MAQAKMLCAMCRRTTGKVARTVKLISWNVNGFRAVLNKGFEETFRKLDADVFCIQETKMQPGQARHQVQGMADQPPEQKNEHKGQQKQR